MSSHQNDCSIVDIERTLCSKPPSDPAPISLPPVRGPYRFSAYGEAQTQMNTKPRWTTRLSTAVNRNSTIMSLDFHNTLLSVTVFAFRWNSKVCAWFVDQNNIFSVADTSVLYHHYYCSNYYCHCWRVPTWKGRGKNEFIILSHVRFYWTQEPLIDFQLYLCNVCFLGFIWFSFCSEPNGHEFINLQAHIADLINYV